MRFVLPLLALAACTDQESPVGSFAGEARTLQTPYSHYVGDIGGFQLLLQRPDLFRFHGRLENRHDKARCGVVVWITLESGEVRTVELERLESGASATLSFDATQRGDAWHATLTSYHCVDSGRGREQRQPEPWGTWTDLPGTVELQQDDLTLETSSFYDHFHATVTHERAGTLRALVGMQLTDGPTTVQLGPSLPVEVSPHGQGIVVFESDRLDPERFQGALEAR